MTPLHVFLYGTPVLLMIGAGVTLIFARKAAAELTAKSGQRAYVEKDMARSMSDYRRKAYDASSRDDRAKVSGEVIELRPTQTTGE